MATDPNASVKEMLQAYLKELHLPSVPGELRGAGSAGPAGVV